MIENSLMQSNFLGRDGFKWWVGQVAPEEAQGSQINGDGWGNRVKVRIMGYHPDDEVELKNEDFYNNFMLHLCYMFFFARTKSSIESRL